MTETLSFMMKINKSWKCQVYATTCAVIKKMKKQFLFLLLIVLGLSIECKSQEIVNIEELKRIWEKFSDGIIKKDYKTIVEISLDTIKCPVCAENTILEQEIMSKIRFTDAYPDTLYDYLAKIPIHDFYINDLYILVDESIIKNLKNYTKINFTILDSVEGIYEVHLIVDDSEILENGFNYEGSQYDFRFKKFNNKLKFTAFYTTP
jgi:hypothetical protein